MKMNIKTSLLALLAITASANDLLTVKTDGNIRVGAQYHDTSDTDGSDLALGANLHIESHAIKGIKAGLTFHTTQVLGNQHDAYAVPFYNSDAASYTIVSEAYLQATLGEIDITLGRQTLDTPFLDSDDIGMVPNTFEAYTVGHQFNRDISFLYSHVRKMSGVDAEIPEDFSKINGGSGLHIVALEYTGIEQTTLAAWHYAMPGFGSFSYGEAGYESSTSSVEYALGAQVALQEYNTDEDATIFGLSASVTEPKSAITAVLAFNSALDEAAENGFGGGPYFSNMEHMTLAEVGADGDMLVYGLEWDASEFITDGLGFSIARANLEDKDGNSGNELDFVMHYGVGENLAFDAIYSSIDNTKLSGDKFENIRLFANYSF